MSDTLLEKYAFFDALRAVPVIEKIILYGSRARGDNRERSDIDLAIVCPQATASDWQKILEILENADTLLMIDCVRFDTLAETNPLKKSIMQDGVVVYEKGRS